jgi:hypothetical protein
MPKWVDECVKRYKRQGLSSDEAWKRCKGAQKDQKKNNSRSKSKKNR